MTKRALLIGINYPGTRAELRGCANDCFTSIDILTRKFGYTSREIIFLTDAKEVPGRESPSAENIRKYIKWLTNDVKDGDQLFFHYSGHGSNIIDRDGDEQDGRDETICPCDYQTGGMITDDELFEILVKPLPKGVKLFSIMDCCHSGTMLDLKYSFSPEKKNQQIQQTSNKNCDAEVIMISGCQDSQTSADAFINGSYSGAMTTAFAQSLENWFRVHKRFPKYKKLVELMYDYMKQNKYTQRPQVNCSQELDLDKTLNI